MDMPKPLFVKPAPGLNVREPSAPFAQLPEFGKAVPDEHYWQRRLIDGDVVPTTEAAIAAGAAAAARPAAAEAKTPAASTAR